MEGLRVFFAAVGFTATILGVVWGLVWVMQTFDRLDMKASILESSLLRTKEEVRLLEVRLRDTKLDTSDEILSALGRIDYLQGRIEEMRKAEDVVLVAGAWRNGIPQYVEDVLGELENERRRGAMLNPQQRTIQHLSTLLDLCDTMTEELLLDESAAKPV